MSVIDRLKIELKLWENDFIQQNGRLPSKEDVKSNPDIRQKHKEYAAIKKNIGTKVSDSVKHLTKFDLPTPKKNIHLQLGPTPQIYGKVLSVFDKAISPSKLFMHQTPQNESSMAGILSTQTDSVVGKPIKRQLDFDTVLQNTIKKEEAETVEKGVSVKSPVFYSPLKFERNVSLMVSKTPVQNRHDQMMIAASPSPLIKRYAKSLYQLAKEHEKILEEFIDMDNDSTTRNLGNSLQQEVIDENDVVLQNPSQIKKRRRKNKVTVGQVGIQETKFKSSVHEKLANLQKKALNELMGVDDGSSEDRDIDNSHTAKVITRRKRKYNTVSDNFVRLKLRKKNRGMKRRK